MIKIRCLCTIQVRGHGIVQNRNMEEEVKVTELEAVRARRSIRKYSDEKMPEDKVLLLEGKLRELNGASGLHMQLVLDHPETFRHFLAHYGGFRQARDYIALVGKTEDGLEEKCGYYGEQFVLFAQTLGLGTCWIGGTFSKRKTVFSVEEGEKLCLILSVGIPDEEGHVHRSRTFEEVTKTMDEIPEWFRNGVEAALLAPTAINQQKFTFVLEKPDKVRIVMGKGPFIRVDEGILRCHFEIGAGKENFVWIG